MKMLKDASFSNAAAATVDVASDASSSTAAAAMVDAASDSCASTAAAATVGAADVDETQVLAVQPWLQYGAETLASLSQPMGIDYYDLSNEARAKYALKFAELEMKKFEIM